MTARRFQEKEAKSVEECFSFKETATVTWINIDGVHDSELVGKLGSHFGVHPLILEDIMTTAQRPKMEDLGDYVYIVLRMLSCAKGEDGVFSEQVSLILGPNFVISFQESAGGDVFDPVRDRIRTGKGRLRKQGPDYLAYALVDAIVDNYFLVLEKLGERVEVARGRAGHRPRPGDASRDACSEEGDDLCAAVGLAASRGHQRAGEGRVGGDSGSPGRPFSSLQQPLL